MGNNFFFSDHAPADVAEGIAVILQETRLRLPTTKILLYGVLPRDAKAGTKSRQSIAELNSIIQKHDDGKWVHFLDISDQFLSRDGAISPDIMPDFLHLSAKGYTIWAQSLQTTL